MRLSVLISVYEYERPEFLDQCLQSLVDQRLRADEVVLVEDGPIPPELDAIISSYAQSLLIVSVKLPTRRGLGYALARGLGECSGALVARMDSDDICTSDRFERQVSFLDANRDIDVLGGFVVEINNDGLQGDVRTLPTNHTDIIESLWRCPLIHPSVMFRKAAILSVGSYNHHLNRRQDYELWFRCAEKGIRFANLDSVLLYYRFGRATHTRQSVGLAFRQGVIGFRGSSVIGLPLWKRLACFLPFLRSFLPSAIQHRVYRGLRRRYSRSAKVG